MTSHARDESILAAIDVDIEPVRLTLLYQVGVVAVASLMLLLPLIYGALIVLVGFGVWYYSQQGMSLFEVRPTEFMIPFVGYVVPLVAGATLMAFMIKPFFAPKRKAPPPRIVTREEQPLLYEFAEKLARAVHAPAPSQIAVDMQVNASASFRDSAESPFDNGLVLTVGLPLLGGLNLAQLAGVLAHEFGHFSQSFAMQFEFIIARLNQWFARIVYERDDWDLKLEELYQRRGSVYVFLPVSVSRLMIWLSRRLLWVLMVFGQGMSAFLSRQMEYHADGYQASLVGGEGYRTTHLRVQVLTVAMEHALAGLKPLWSERRLADDLLALLINELDTLMSDTETVRWFEANLMDVKTGFFDSHPAPRDGLSRVLESKAKAQIDDSRPASELCRGFDSLSASLTLDFYRQHVDEKVDERNFLPLTEVLAERKAREANGRALRRFFLGVPLWQFGVFPGSQESETMASSYDVLFALQEARRGMSQMAGEMTSHIEYYLDAEERGNRAKLALTLMSANVKFKAEEFGLESADWSELEQQLEEVEKVLVDRRERLMPATSAVWSRIDACLTLLRSREQHPVLKDLNCDTERLGQLVTTLAILGGIWPKLRALHRLVDELNVLFQEVTANFDKRAFQLSVSDLADSVADRTTEVLQVLAEVEYPFKHLEGSVSIAEYAAPEPSERTAKAILETGMEVVERLVFLYVRIWGELVSVAEQVEKALGLPLLRGELQVDYSSGDGETGSH